MPPKTVIADKDSWVARDTVRQQHNNLVNDVYYLRRNGVISNTAATLPVVATATVTSKVKTTNATVVQNAGVLNAVAATDNAWTLTGPNLAVGFFRRYLLLVDINDVFTVLASTDAATAAACVFPAIPDGQAVVGILTIQNGSAAVFIPATTLLGAAGITVTYIDGADDSILTAAIVLP